MRERFDEKTEDLHFYLTIEEALSLRSNPDHTPILSDDEDGSTHLMNRDSKDYIEIYRRPRTYNKPQAVILSDRAYEDLLRDGECSTRYGMSSKIKVIIDRELATPIT